LLNLKHFLHKRKKLAYPIKEKIKKVVFKAVGIEKLINNNCMNERYVEDGSAWYGIPPHIDGIKCGKFNIPLFIYQIFPNIIQGIYPL